VADVDHAARTQVSIEGHLDDDLALVGELLRQNGAGPFVGVPVGVVEHHDVRCNRSSIRRVASHSMVCAAADAPSTHGEDTTISDLPSRAD
jgi:hypothetical protein